MLTLKQLRRPAYTWTAPKPKHVVQAIALTALAALVIPNVTSLISHQIRIEAAGGTSCLRVSADRKSQVRKYGADCNP